jgi:hypothetical protein
MLHIDIPTLSEFKALALVKGGICLSLYLPISRLGTDARSIAPRSRTSKEALARLKEAGTDKKTISVFEERFEHLAGSGKKQSG